ncbi:hypothetical protein ACP275_10G176600 [Erythranthe tilingii]
MKEADKKRGPIIKEKSRSARSDTKERKVQEKKGGRNLKAKDMDVKPSSNEQNNGTLVSSLKNGTQPSEVNEDANRSDETLHNTKTLKVNDNNSSDMEVVDESDVETSIDSVSSQGDSQTNAEEEKAEKVITTPKKVVITENLQTTASKEKPTKVAQPEKTLSNSNARSSSDNLKNMKVHPKPLSDSPEVVDLLDEVSNATHSVCSDDEGVNTEENDKKEEQAALDRRIEEMETRIKSLESELREVAALEIALYSVVPEHGSSAHKVHTPARRLSRLYIHACKYWSQDKRATIARNTVSGIVLVSKSCGNDVSRLTFWLSNIVVLREILSQAFGSSCNSAKVFESYGSEKKSSPPKRRNSSASKQLNKQGFLQFIDDWQETRTFTSALEKVESWIFSRIVESIWWQTLTPNMQSPDGDSITNKGAERLLGPALGDHKQGNFSINLWKNAFHDALKRLCPVRAGGHGCGCLPVLARKVMEQCTDRLDVAMFNAILRESAHEIPTDPVSDPIVDSKVLPIPAGDLCFGSGAQLKNSVGNWTRWLSEFLGADANSSAKDENRSLEGTEEPKSFTLLNALSDLLMLPKDMLMDRTIRMEVCPSISLPLVKRVLCNFSPDEFCPDPVAGAVLEAVNAECIIERRVLGNPSSSFPYSAAPIVYTPPSSADVAEKVAEADANAVLSKSASCVQRKGYTSDEELDELEGCLNKLPLSPTEAVGSGDRKEAGYDGANARYDLLREVWQAT